MTLLAEQIELSPDERSEILKMAEFIALFHGPYFLQTSLSVAAPRLDLELWKHVEKYADKEPGMAKAAQLSILRHLWYLTEECVIFSLFDDAVSDEEKAEMATELVAQQRQESLPPGKPKFPDKAKLSVTAKLSDFVGPRSWLAFSRLATSHNWLHLPPDQWAQDEEFNKMSHIMKDLVVTNDAAEKAVKDVTENANAARDGQMRGRIIAVTCAHRSQAPSLLKSELNAVRLKPDGW